MFLHALAQLNTYIDPFDSVCKQQSFVECVDVYPVCGVFVHEWTLQGMKSRNRNEMCYCVFHTLAKICLSNRIV